MNRSIPAIFDAGVFRPLEPVDLAEGTRVEVQLQASSSAASGSAASGEVDEQTQPAWQEFLDRMEALPDDSPQDGLSNRDHDRIIYGG